jgi:HAD superfamily hydrolase (TIGR01509 family)
MIRAVVFDLDGVIISSEGIWDEVRAGLARESGGRWAPGAQREMEGLSTQEWTAYMHDVLGVAMPPERIGQEVERRLLDRYRGALPLIPGALEAVTALAGRLPLGLASSSTRSLIDGVLGLAGLAGAFAVTVSSEEVPRGKPWPDVYLRALDLLAVAPAEAVAVEDSGPGIRAAAAAGMRVIAIPDALSPPPVGDLALAGTVLASIHELTPEALGA